MKRASGSQTGQGTTEGRFGRARLRAAVWVAAALAAGALLRLWFVAKFFEVTVDGHLYANLAKNILLHGQYSIADGSGVLHPTLIRLPGYPLFLAACFQFFGVDKFFPVVVVQIFCELTGCVMLALTARRICPAGWNDAAKSRAFFVTLWIAALCPFTSSYAASPLTESLTLFCITVAMWLTVRFQDRQGWAAALGFTLAITFAALLRPDGALIGVAFGIPMVLALSTGIRDQRSEIRRINKRRNAMGMVCFLIAAAPFGVWAAHNWSQFRVFQPLAPRYATDPGEPTWQGWQRWVKTWSLDFKNTYEIYWNVPDGPFDMTSIPARAFDSKEQRDRTAVIARDYENNDESFTADLDARLGRLADERIAAHPLRYYVLLPAARVADMLLRPRVENLPIDQDWWVYRRHWDETILSWLYVVLNLAYLLLGVIGICLRPRLWPWMLLYFVLRCALLATVEGPEARYTLEFFPMWFVLGGVAVARLTSGSTSDQRRSSAAAY
jgi:Dolichyl-phosphate-mannose-protein mannosyltransferase